MVGNHSSYRLEDSRILLYDGLLYILALYQKNMTVQFIPKTKANVDPSPLFRMPYIDHWKEMGKINEACFGISENDGNKFIVEMDYRHNENDVGIHTVMMRSALTYDKNHPEKYWTPVSPPLTDKELPAFLRGMEVACKMANAHRSNAHRSL